MARGVKVMPRMVRPQAILPPPIEIPDSHMAMRNGRLDELKGDKPALAVDEIDRTRLHLILDPDFNKRDARIIADERDLDGGRVPFSRADCVRGRRVFRVNADEAAPLGNVNELARVSPDIESVMTGRIVIVIEFDGLNCNHQDSPATSIRRLRRENQQNTL